MPEPTSLAVLLSAMLALADNHHPLDARSDRHSLLCGGALHGVDRGDGTGGQDKDQNQVFRAHGVLPGINERDCREVKGMPRAACDGPQPGGMDCSFGRRAAGHQLRRARNSASALQVWPRPERAFSGGPWNTMRPPPSPPSGPRSMIQSASAIT